MIYYKSSKDFRSNIIRLIRRNLSDEELEALTEWSYYAQYERVFSGSRFVLPRGCKRLGWEKLTIVEMEFRLLYGTLQRLISKYSGPPRSWVKWTNADIVLIYRDTHNVILPEINESFLKIITDKELFERLGDERETERGRDIPSNEEKFTRCKEAFQQGNCTLFIGAGVGMSVGLPGWGELLTRMKDELVAENGQVVRKRDLRDIKCACDRSTLIEARYIKVMRESTGVFADAVKDALYSRKANLKAPLLNSVADLVDYKSTASGRKVIGVITYNYDDLLECVLSRRGATRHITIDGGGIRKGGLFPVYHVHGVMPFYYRKLLYASGQIVLSEEDYHELYNSQDRWANSIQRRALNQSTCIFIGMSMNDPNLRRLLAATRWEKQSRFAFLKRVNLSDNSLKKQNEKTLDKMFYDLGVHVIWYDDHSQLPALLYKLIV